MQRVDSNVYSLKCTLLYISKKNCTSLLWHWWTSRMIIVVASRLEVYSLKCTLLHISQDVCTHTLWRWYMSRMMIVVASRLKSLLAQVYSTLYFKKKMHKSTLTLNVDSKSSRLKSQLSTTSSLAISIEMTRDDLWVDSRNAQVYSDTHRTLEIE